MRTHELIHSVHEHFHKTMEFHIEPIGFPTCPVQQTIFAACGPPYDHKMCPPLCSKYNEAARYVLTC